MKRVLLFGVFYVLTLANICFGAVLGQNEKGVYCVKDDGQLAVSEWVTIDTDGQGIVEYYYYFGTDGIMLKSTYTPDGYLVNENGQWVKDGFVQTKNMPKKKNPYLLESIKNSIQHCKVSKVELLYNPGEYNVMIDIKNTGKLFDVYGAEINGKKYYTSEGNLLRLSRPKYQNKVMVGNFAGAEVSGFSLYDNRQYVSVKENIDIDKNITSLICLMEAQSGSNEEDYYFIIDCNSLGLIGVREVDSSYVDSLGGKDNTYWGGKYDSRWGGLIR